MPRPATSNGIDKVGSGYRWRVQIGGVRHHGIEKTEAAARLARAETEIRYGGNPNTDPTVAELLAAHIAHTTRGETTLENWRWAYEALPQPFLNRQAREVTAPIVAHLWRQLRNEPPHRLVKLSNLCSSAWQDAVDMGVLAANPWRIARVPRPPAQAEIVPPDPDDVRRLIAAADDPQFALWLHLASVTGARGGELCALQWDDVDWSGGSVMIKRSLTRTGQVTPTKTGRKGHRRVELDDDTLEQLKQHKETQWSTTESATNAADTALPRSGKPSRAADTASPATTVATNGTTRSGRTGDGRTTTRPSVAPVWIFPRPDGHPMRPDGAAKRLQRLCRITGVDISPHDLRHFAVTQWLAIGMPIPDVAAMVGDNPKTVMQTYAHHIPSRRRDMVTALARLLREP